MSERFRFGEVETSTVLRSHNGLALLSFLHSHSHPSAICGPRHGYGTFSLTTLEVLQGK